MESGKIVTTFDMQSNKYGKEEIVRSKLHKISSA